MVRIAGVEWIFAIISNISYASGMVIRAYFSIPFAEFSYGPV